MCKYTQNVLIHNVGTQRSCNQDKFIKTMYHTLLIAYPFLYDIVNENLYSIWRDEVIFFVIRILHTRSSIKYNIKYALTNDH